MTNNIGPVSKDVQAWLMMLALDQSPATTSNQSTVGPVDTLNAFAPPSKQTIEDIAQTMPPPYLPPQLLTQLFQDMNTALGFNPSRNAGLTPEQTLGLGESATVLSCLANWLQSQQQEQVLTKEARAQERENPINQALSAYIAAHTQKRTDATTTKQQTVNAQAPVSTTNNLILSQQLLRSSPILTAILKTADPVLVAQATGIAQGTIMRDVLNRLIIADEIRQEAIKKDATQSDIKRQKERTTPPGQQLLYRYVEQVNTDHLALTQPVLSLFVIATLAPAQDTTSSIGITPVLNMMPPPAHNDLAFISNAYMQMAMYWSMPIAVTLLGNTIATAKEPAIDEAAVKAYGLALMTLLQSPESTKFLQSVITQSAKEGLTEDKLQQYIGLLKITLLTNVLIALERLQLGHFTSTEFLALFSPGQNIPYPESDLRYSIVKIIRQELEYLTEKQKKILFGSLSAFIDSNPSIAKLINPSKAFIALCNPRYSSEHAQAQSV